MNTLMYKNFPLCGTDVLRRAIRTCTLGLLCLGLALLTAPVSAAQNAPASPTAAETGAAEKAPQADVAPSPAPAADGTRELWTGKLYSSTYRAGVCLKSDGSVQGVLLLRVPSGKVDVYHFYGQHAAGRVSAKHSSGHTFDGQLENEQVVSGTIRLKSGFTIELEGQRTHHVELTETCRPLPD